MISAIPPSLSSLFPGAWGQLASTLANHLWQSTLFAVLAALLTLALKNNHARTRYWLWFTASAKFLFPFSLLIVLGTHLAWLHSSAKHAAADTGTYFVMQQVGQPFDFADLSSLAAPPSPPVLSRTARLRAALGGSLLPPALAFIWLAGFLFILTRWITRWAKIAAVLRTAPALSTGREADALQRIARAAGLPRGIALKSLPIAIEPGIFGLFRPVLLWPEGISSHLDDAQLESVIAHEVCHVLRRDNLTAALHMAVEAIFWFHPLVWWLQTRLIAEREAACDEDVLQLCGHARAYAYAESILKVCEFSIVSPLPCISGVTGADLRQRIAAIVSARALTRLSWPKKILILAAAVCVASAPVLLGMVKTVPLYSQILHSDAPLPSFEVATIRPTQISGFAAPAGIDPSKIVHAQEVRITSGPAFSDQVERINTAKMLLADAYHLPAFSKAQIVGGSDWTDQTMYQIKAKISDAQYAALLKLPAAQQQEQVRLMEQSLLADRFQLRVHFETRELPVYALEVTKSGPKMTPAKIDSIPAESATGAPQTPPSTMNMTGKGDGFKIQAKNASPAQLILLLQQQPEVGNRLMVDKTGLIAKYDLTLAWTRDLTAAADTGPAPADAAPSLFTALKDQLGLELVETKAPVEVIVIDHIEKPTVDGAEVQPPNLNTPPVPVATILNTQTFAVSTIKPSIAATTDWSGINTGHGRLDGHNVTLLRAIIGAYGVGPHQVVGGPDWINTLRWDMQAKTDKDINDDATLNAMQAALIADRFKLVLHRETRTMPAYVLEVGKNGPKLAKGDGGDSVTDMRTGAGGKATLKVSNTDMSFFAALLARKMDLPVVNETGLKGVYNFELNWTPDDTTAANGPDALSIFTAIQEQLGLHLRPAKAPVEVLVIDHAELPSQN